MKKTIMNFKEPIYVSEELHGIFRLRDGDGTVYSYIDGEWIDEFNDVDIELLPHGLVFADGVIYKLEDRIRYRVTDVKKIKKIRETTLWSIPDCFFVCEFEDEKILLCVNQETLFYVATFNSSDEVLIELTDAKTAFVSIKDDNDNTEILRYKIRDEKIIKDKYLFEDIDNKGLDLFYRLNHKTFAYEDKIFYPNGRDLLHIDFKKRIAEVDYTCKGANEFILSIECNKEGNACIWIEGDYGARFEILDLKTKVSKVIKEPVEEDAYFFGWIDSNHIWMKLLGNSSIWLKNISDDTHIVIAETYTDPENASENDKKYRQYLNEGITYKDNNDVENAIISFKKALKYAEAEDEEQDNSSSKYNVYCCRRKMADTYYKNDKKEEAYHEYMVAKNILESSLLDHDEFGLYKVELVECVVQLSIITNDRKYFQTAYDISKELYEMAGEIINEYCGLHYDATCNMACYLMEKEEYDEALVFLKECIDLSLFALDSYPMNTDIEYWIVNAYLNYGELQLQLKNIAAAKESFANGIDKGVDYIETGDPSVLEALSNTLKYAIELEDDSTAKENLQNIEKRVDDKINNRRG